MSHPLHPTVAAVTARIAQRSEAARKAYLARCAAMAARPRGSDRLGCANVAHAVAALPSTQKIRVVAERAPTVAVVTAYNDMLSAHRPYEGYPEQLRRAAAQWGAVVQVAGGVPAMCDGITQGEAGMELSLFSRDAIARSTAIALSHDTFDAALLLGICDKIVPGLLIGALHFGHLPCVFVPSGPMGTGLSNADKAKMREKAAQGLVDRDGLMAAEQASYHSPGTCTFYGTANSNQMLMEAMGLHVPGAAFIAPGSPLRQALTDAALDAALTLASEHRSSGTKGIGHMVDERSIVNAMAALLATGGSTNHLIHWVAVARAAGLHIDWGDFAELSAVVPLLARVYPNGQADVNAFQASGGPGAIIAELLAAGLMHADAASVDARGMAAYARLPVLRDDGALVWQALPEPDAEVVRGASNPFSATGGLAVLDGNLGRAVIKVSSVPDDRWVIEAPAMVFASQAELLAAFERGELQRDFIAVVPHQGPRACGMPELHKLTPPLAVLQGQGHRVALVTDGRMSGASGRVPAAIHVCPEAHAGGPLARVRTGDVIRLDAHAGTLEALVDPVQWAARELTPPPPSGADHGMGRELFALMRQGVTGAEQGACTW